MHFFRPTSRIVQNIIGTVKYFGTLQPWTFQAHRSYAVIKSSEKQSPSKLKTKYHSVLSAKGSGMRIATLQFAPRLGDVQGNIERADRLLKLMPLNANDGPRPDDDGKPGIEELRPDILVLPEMAFSGYNFPSLEAIRPHLEVQGNGPSAQWAQRTARRLKCKVCVGYPEIYRGSETSNADNTDEKENETGVATTPAKLYNSLLVVDEAGEVIHNYRKRFLYYTDESWASEGEAESSFKSLEFPTGILDENLVTVAATTKKSIQVPTTFGICMDINPYKFEAPFDAYEFAHRVLDSRSHLVIISAAWLTNDANSLAPRSADLPDMDTFNYWLHRFWPLLEKKINYGDRQLEGFDSSTETKVILVFANRTGMEDGGPECFIRLAVYAGTSTIIAITQRKGSPALDVKIHCWGIKGAKEEGICFADTESEPEMTFVLRKKGGASD